MEEAEGGSGVSGGAGGGLAPGGPGNGLRGSAGGLLRWAALLLRAAGFETPRLDAEVLLRHVTGFSRETLLAHPERPLTADQAEAFTRLVERRREGCPVAYLTGHREFMSLDFEVTPAVLIPRPDTELLVEVAADLARRRLAAAGDEPRLVLADVGTGSGAVAVSLAHLLPGALIYATDVSADALAVARRNAARLLGAAVMEVNIVFRQGDLLEALARDLGGAGGPGPGAAGAGVPGAPGRLLDGVVANLPYVPDEDWERLGRGVRDFEPPESLRGGSDGLDLVRRLAGQLPRYLAPGGFVCLEIGPGQAAATSDILVRTGLFPGGVEVHRDLGGHERVVAAPAGY